MGKSPLCWLPTAQPLDPWPHHFSPSDALEANLKGGENKVRNKTIPESGSENINGFNFTTKLQGAFE